MYKFEIMFKSVMQHYPLEPVGNHYPTATFPTADAILRVIANAMGLKLESEEEYAEYMEVDLNKYSNISVETVIHGVQNSLTFFTALGYTVLFAKIIGKKLILTIKKRKLVNDEIKKELKK